MLKNRFQNVEVFVSVLLIVIGAILAYGLLISWLGFYDEDWIWLHALYTKGKYGLYPMFAIDRPLIAPIYALLYPLLGVTPILWHFFVLIVRILGGLALLWTLRGLWPKRRFETTMMALLFTIYPGSMVQHSALVYTSFFIVLLLGMLSLGSTVHALRTTTNQKTFIILTLFAMLFGLGYILLIEFFIGFEALRLILIWYISGKNETESISERIIYVGRKWLPYFVITAGFLVWRIFFYTSQRRFMNVNDRLAKYTGENALESFVLLFIRPIRYFFDLTIFVWFAPVYNQLTIMEWKMLSASIILFFPSMFVVLLYYWWLKKQDLVGTVEDVKDRNWAYNTLLIGALAIPPLFVIMVIVGRPVLLSGYASRYALPPMVAATIFTVGAVYFIVKPAMRSWLLAGLVGLSIITHFSNANVQRVGWQDQRNFWWQLSWRAPTIKPGTVIVSDVVLHYQSIWGPVNLIYNSEEKQQAIAGESFVDRLNAESIIRDIVAEKVWNRTTYGIIFEEDYKKSLIVAKQNGTSCLRVMDDKRLELPTNASTSLHLLAPYSHVDRIITNDTDIKPPTSIFGNEPAHTWCYYFQKADLASQKNDWQTVVKLGDEARDKGYKPRDKTEWLPFIEGYSNVGRYNDITDIAELILPTPSYYDSTPLELFLQPPLCQLIVNRLKSSNNADKFLQDFPKRCK